MKKTSFLLLFVFLLVISVSYAADTYKPYIHKANLPEHPKIILYGQYRTSLFPGAATYSYGIEVPRGTNGLQPLVFASYNSQSASQRPGILGSGWAESSIWTIPEDFINSSGDTGIRVIDINGDGLPDILQGAASTKKAWLNNASGWENYDAVWQPPTSFIDGNGKDEGTRFIDANLDGLVDIIKQDDSAWLNNGSGWQATDGWKSPADFIVSNENLGRSIADVNGDGFADIIISTSGGNTTWIKNSTYPQMLKNIENEYGGITNISYASSTQFNNSENVTSQLGFNIYVVSNVTTANGLSDDFNFATSTSYNYSLGKYNYGNSEFRGFGVSKEIMPSKIVSHYFHQDNPRRSKEFKTQIYDTNLSIFSKSEKEYAVVFSDGVYNISLDSSAEYLYDGSNSPVITNKSYTYDWYGNLLYLEDQGDVSVAEDERYFNYSYGFDKQNWIMDRAARETIYDDELEKVSETKYYYDNLGLEGVSGYGRLTKTERWDSGGDNVFTYFSYDGFGNVIKKTDSLGNSYKFSYDSTHTYPVTEINPLGHITTRVFDLRTGNVLSFTQNDITASFVYDAHGRIAKEVMPFDTNFSPTKEYEYSFDGAAPEKVKVSMKTTANRTDRMSYFYDGFANLIQVKSEVEDGREIVKNIFYDSEYRVESEQNLYFADYSLELSPADNESNYVFYNYDALDRVVSVTNPDGTSKTVSFEKYNISSYDENGNRHDYLLDAFGRIAEVHEYNTNDVGLQKVYNTTYEYDSNDNLVRITDEEGNEFLFFYDSLSRKTAMDDPDLGSWSYGYDKNSNLISQTDAKNNTIRLGYDALNRVTEKNSSDVNITFSYDGAYSGVLTNMSMNDINFSFEYDDRLRLIEMIMLADDQSFTTEFIYDSQNRLISKVGLGELDFIFNRQGKVRKIPGFVTDSSYNAFGSILNRTYGNGLIQQFSYDEENNRLTNIYISGVQNLTYDYDSVENIISILDPVNNRNHYLGYDGLNRLINATIGDDVYKYSYNPLGNMMKIVHNNESKKFVYNGDQAHAPSQIIEGEAGVDVYNPREIDTGRKSRLTEFWLLNDKNTSILANISVWFDDNKNFTNNSITLDSNIWFLVENNYSYGRDYSVNITADSENISDSQLYSIKFGTRAKSLKVIDPNVSVKTFEFIIENDVSDKVYNVSWNCSNDIDTIYSTDLAGNQSLYDYLQHNYTLPGEKTFTCTVTSNDGTESETVEFTLNGLEIEDYDILLTNISRRVVAYDVVNYFTPIEANISMEDETASFSRITTLESDEDVMVFVETNYSSDGSKTFSIDVSSSNYSNSYSESFDLESVSIENYERVNQNTGQILVFGIRNKWYSGVVNWSVSEPSIQNLSTLNTGELLLVAIEHNYTQGSKTPRITAVVSSVQDEVTDYFSVTPLEISSLAVISEDRSKAVSELVVLNKLDDSQQFSWRLDTEIENITSSLINLTGNVFIYIGSYYNTEGIYRQVAVINSSSYDDNESIGVVIS
ncbi:hypothetical protein QT06_C0001G0127 [archaeon GW2011_AR15]|nr:hypothetical protein QT06_C0001G0127 [archaeon GW2011_AR15]